MIELALGMKNTAMDYLLAYIQNSLFFSILDYLEDRYINHCNYQCFKHWYRSTYCYICRLLDNDLTCPLKGEVKLKDIKENEFPVECLKSK